MSLLPASSNGNPVNPRDKPFQNRYIPTFIPSEEFENYMKRTPEKIPVTRPYQPSTAEEIQPNEGELLTLKGKDDTYLSFGDDGTTASVTEWGRLMQFSRYLGPGRSSVFVADSEHTEKPCDIVGRGRTLQNMARDGCGFGNIVTMPDDNRVRQVSFLRNRWPRVVVSESHRELVMQWMVKEGVVIQQSVIKNLTKERLKFELEFDLGVLTRDLDFADRSYGFNETDNNYIEGAGPNGYGFVKVHRFDVPYVEKKEHGDPTIVEEDQNLEGEQHNAGKKLAVVSEEEKQEEPEAVGLVIGFFVDGEARKREDLYRREWHVEPGKCREFVAGYKLVLLRSKMSDWKPLVLSAANVDIDRFLSEESSSHVIDVGLDYATGRNLEHILSVCAIPIPPGHVWDYGDMKPKVAEPAIALTCGDMSGHRVCTSASFFAFRFLTTIARHLGQHDGHDVHDLPKQLRDRIKRTCKGHLEWIFKTAERKDHIFARDYWVNGKIMFESQSRVSNDLTNTPYQVLKAFDYYREFGEQEFVESFLGNSSEGFAMDWIKKLDEGNRQDSYAWPHPQHPRTTEFEKYRLDDHVWIWGALKAISTIFDREGKSKQTRNNSKLARIDGKRQSEEASPEALRQKYEPSKVQREMTRRFTTDNDSLKQQKMLAVTRSVRENRFDFHSRDTALFYDLPGEKPKPGEEPEPANMLADNITVWKNTLNYQKYLEENQDTEWDNPLMYALIMLMARKGFSINKTTGKDVVKGAQQTLMGSMLPNGLFPTQMTEFTQEEELFEEKDYHDFCLHYRDFYFHVGFEVPYVLWACKAPLEGYRTIKTPSKALQLIVPSDPSSSHAADGGTYYGKDGAPVQSIEIPLLNGRTPFNNFVDSHNVVEISDEWLYSDPLFLGFEQEHEELPEERKGDKKCDHAPPGGGYALIVDVPKTRKKPGKDSSGPSIPDQEYSTGDLREQLQKPRTIRDAKKRFIWLPYATEGRISTCISTAHEAERAPISLFVERHAKYEWYFFDEVAPVHNKWETEFHMSFLQLSQSAEPPGAFGGQLVKLQYGILPDLGNNHLVRASAGYRFLGDFFDHYWTCHFIENYPCLTQIKSPLAQPAGEEDRGCDFWQQRKVLELILFNRIINEVNRSMGLIVELIQEQLTADQFGRLSLAHLKVDRYLDMSSRWENYIQILDVMGSDFAAMMDNITAWENRERGRQQGQPQWTT